MSTVIDLFEKQRDLGLEHVKRLQPSVEKAGHRLASALLETILHDSRKHAALCPALIDVEGGGRSRYTGRGHGHRLGAPPRHPTARPGRGAPDPGIYDHLLADERRHHSLLRRLSNIIDNDTAAYDEYLGLIQKYLISPPPGGEPTFFLRPGLDSRA